MGMYQPDVFAGMLPVAPADAAVPAHAPVLVAWATQTGAAEGYARASDEQLRAVGIPTRMVEFYDLQPDMLESTRQALFIVSTTYDGDPPDMAEDFARQYMQHAIALPALGYGLLALGDRDYDVFCGFGRRFHQWLLASGARTLFDPVEVDDENPDALEHWFGQVAALTQASAPGAGMMPRNAVCAP